MSKKKKIIYTILLCLLCLPFAGQGQEHTGSLRLNRRAYCHPPMKMAGKTTTSLTLPFFDDFTGYSLQPDHSRWVENQVYVNNNMCVSPISRGVATFDALDEHGIPWDQVDNGDFRFTDSLTSQPIDLSGYTPADSLYLSFFYQPQGMGYYPIPADTLFLFVRIRFGDWVPVWKMPGTSLQPFQQVMIPITDTLDFYSDFQFRFVNFAALNYSDANWNIDYVRLDAHRNMYDTAINDIAYTSDPTFLLNDYTSMPYRQFMANPSAERASVYHDSVRNTNSTPEPITYAFTATDVASGTVLQTTVTNTSLLPEYSITELSNNGYTTTVPIGSAFQKVVFENKYYIQQTTATGVPGNDTVIKDQVFDNYLAYDDGTAEQSYYLSLFPSLPGKISIEYHLNQPDTMQGMAIYFGRMDPSSSYKTFSIELYSALAGINGATADNLLYTQDPCYPGYGDTLNEFWIYKFDNPVPLPAGTFYAGVLMPAESGSDSLYFGFDRNRVGGNHAYYNVLSSWNPSLLHGAIMMRPLLGQAVTSSNIRETAAPIAEKWQLAPNPATDKFSISFPGDGMVNYTVTNIQGKVILSGTTANGGDINIANFTQGMYFVTISANGRSTAPLKLIKL